MIDSHKTLPLEQARQRLRMPHPVFHAILGSGLLGYWANGQVAVTAVEHFERYGTQWQPGLERHWGPDPYQEMGVPPGIEGGEQPADTGTHVQIAPTDGLDAARDDTAWFAQFYIRPNQFFFPDPAAFALVGPPTLKLSAPTSATGTSLPVTLYPDPSGALAMLMVSGGTGSIDAAHALAYDVVAPVLDELSVKYDQPLPIPQSFVVGVPSGTMNIFLPKVPTRQVIAEPVTSGCPHPELREGYALYREAVSSSNPLHKFLTLWKTYENIVAARSAWRRKHRRKLVPRISEVIPSMWAYRPYNGLTFDQAKQRLNTPFRVALAHGDVQQGRPRTGATAKDVGEVAGEVPVIRYMARTVLQNFRAALDTPADINAPDA